MDEKDEVGKTLRERDGKEREEKKLKNFKGEIKKERKRKKGRYEHFMHFISQKLFVKYFLNNQ